MDIVITYVNGLDPEWQKQYEKITHRPVLTKRYRDWGFLPYLLRGIEKFMPFIDNVFLVVASESQVPVWVNREQLHVVLHKDIIPKRFLPTFNSTTIELFLHRIPNLSEEFIYFNDDIFPVAPMNSDVFFQQGKILMKYSWRWLALDMYNRHTRQSDRLARLGAGLKNGLRFIRPQHTCTPMLKSKNTELYSKIESEILSTITLLRSNENVNQYLYTDYLYYTGNAICKRIPKKHCSMAVYSAEAIAKYILNPQKPLICINDVSMSDEKQERMRATLCRAFEKQFPQKSRFEK